MTWFCSLLLTLLLCRTIYFVTPLTVSLIPYHIISEFCRLSRAKDSQTSYNCPICRREFKRYDLLQRHEKRNICGDDPTGSNPFKRPRSESSSQEEFSVQHAPPAPPMNPMTGQLPDSSSFQTAIFPVASNNTAMPTNGTYDGSLQVPNSSNPHVSDFSVEDIMGDWGFSLWAPEQWEALLHETLAPPFNEPMVDMPWDMPMLPRMQQQESAERGHDNVASVMLVARLQRSYPVSCHLFLCHAAD